MVGSEGYSHVLQTDRRIDPREEGVELGVCGVEHAAHFR